MLPAHALPARLLLRSTALHACALALALSRLPPHSTTVTGPLVVCSHAAMSGPFQRKLRALGYPAPASSTSATAVASEYTSLDSQALRTLVVWLEFTKIRFYPVAQRTELKAIESPTWPQTFSRYLDDLTCPRAHSAVGMSGESVAAVVEWLLSQAIGAEYSDHAGEFNSLSRMSYLGGKGAATASAGQAAGASTVALDCTSTAVRAAFENEVSRLAQLFQLPFDRTQLASILRVIRKRVEESILAAAAAQGVAAVPASTSAASAASAAPSAAAAASSSSSAITSKVARPGSKATRFVHTIEQTPLPQNREEVFVILDRMDMGFSTTGDSLVDHAAQVFRLLFLHDLRSTQNLANELMALAQEYTSDPKTDAKLGKVGI